MFFVLRPMKIVTFLQKNGDPAKRVVDFPWERDTVRDKIMEIVEDFDEKSYNNNGKSWKSSGILRVNPIFSFFFLFSSFFSIFFIILFSSSFSFHFFMFSIFPFFHVLSFSFSFFQFLSLVFFLFLVFLFFFFSFSFSLLGAQNFVTISLDSSYVQKSISGPISGGR